MRAAQPPTAQPVRFEMAVYLSVAPKQSAAELTSSLARDFPHFAPIKDATGDHLTRPVIFVHFPVMKDYAPPSRESLKYFGRGLSPAQEDQLLASTAAVAVTFFTPTQRDTRTVQQACKLMLKLAEQTGGILWDEQTREAFAPDFWKTNRIDTFQDDLPQVRKHITIHFYVPGDNQMPRAITLGMAKFGCPDVVASDLTRSHAQSVGTLMNLVCQTMVERGVPDGQTIALDLAAIRHKTYAEELKKTLLDNATGKAVITIADATHLTGDPDNRLIELLFDPARANVHEKREKLLATMFGSKDDVIGVKHDAALLAASSRAKARIPQLRKRFQQHADEREQLMVKGPFKQPNGADEWMWVEVTGWDDRGNISGILQNEPDLVPNLHAGAKVTVREQDVFDYTLHKSDGTTEGGETDKLIEQQQQKR